METVTIKKINRNGKWLEFWFEEIKSERWTRCCKYGHFLTTADYLADYLLNHGAVGCTTVWKSEGSNWFLEKVLPDSTKLEKQYCRDCGTVAELGQGFGNAYGELDVAGKRTVVEGSGDLITCWKCPECGHSWT